MLNNFLVYSSFQMKGGNLMKRILLSLVCGVLVLGLVTGCGKQANNSNSNNNSSNIEVNYYDKDRDLKDTYTFKEAVSKFAFKVNNTTLIFEENDKTTFEWLMQDETIHNDLLVFRLSILS